MWRTASAKSTAKNNDKTATISIRVRRIHTLRRVESMHWKKWGTLTRDTIAHSCALVDLALLVASGAIRDWANRALEKICRILFGE